ncbi:unnamed protein product [Gongylonema pulchrum]|uniref:PEROXIDASE_4 domain-containing protein n=1 Tax=Gongylonema pulchrum TaxID=637853 RepID=A0A183EIN0_9BILA|nr:unnamed protein product [Gongylonema pulchrum]
MFTGLNAANHFGRPNFDAFFRFVQSRHKDVSLVTATYSFLYLNVYSKLSNYSQLMEANYLQIREIGVFSCGPNSINKEVRRSCTAANRIRNAPSFYHRFETF